MIRLSTLNLKMDSDLWLI